LIISGLRRSERRNSLVVKDLQLSLLYLHFFLAVSLESVILIIMTQRKIRELILGITRGNLAWADPMSKVCLEQHDRHPEKFPIGSTFQSAEEVLEDIIGGLTSLQEEIRITASFNSAQL